MLKEIHEEILEAIWVSLENKDSHFQSISNICSAHMEQKDLDYLAEQNLIVNENSSYKFTKNGEELASKIIRRHRLAEVLVGTILKTVSPEMEEIACKVEHTLLPEVEKAICILLGHPDIAPDGTKIPPGKCCKDKSSTISNVVTCLDQVKSGADVKISYIKPSNHSELHQLLSFGLNPGTLIHVHRTSPSFCIKFENTELALDREIAKNIYVVKC